MIKNTVKISYAAFSDKASRHQRVPFKALFAAGSSLKKFALLGLLTLGACSSTNYKNTGGHDLLRRGDYLQAADEFGKKSKETGANQLLYLLDQGTALFAARNYDEAIKIFLQAEDLAEIKDYTSVSEEVGSLVTSANVRGYKGEDFEKILINVYLALCFAAKGEISGAQVEARKINLLLYRLNNEGKRNYGEAPFARYLAALMWEAGNDFNAAYIDYKKTYELDPNFPGIGADLIATARRLRFHDDEKKWVQTFPDAKSQRGKNEGEIVIFFEKGLSPIKQPRFDAANLPQYVSRSSEITGAKVFVNGSDYGHSEVFVNIEGISYQWLESRINRMRTANVAGAAMKGALALGLGAASKNESLGWLAFYALMASDQADTRSWMSLPQNIQVKRVSLSPGTYNIDVDSVVGQSSMKKHSFPGIQLRAGQKVFLTVR